MERSTIIYDTGRRNHFNFRKRLLGHCIEWLNKSDLGCFVKKKSRSKAKYYDESDRIRVVKEDYVSTSIEGTSKDGRSIYIQFYEKKFKRVTSAEKKAFMKRMEAMGAIVGCAFDYHDCYAIISGNKRLKRTYLHRGEYGKRKKSGHGVQGDQPSPGHERSD